MHVPAMAGADALAGSRGVGEVRMNFWTRCLILLLACIVWCYTFSWVVLFVATGKAGWK